jgi:hypothetical protein
MCVCGVGWGVTQLLSLRRLGDEGSAFGIGRTAIRSLLDADDERCSLGTRSPQHNHPTRAAATPTNTILPFHQDLLDCFGVSCAADIIPKTYSPHATGFEASESARKLWIAQAARTVFDHAFSPVASPSRTEARKVAEEATEPLVEMIERLVADKSVIVPPRSALLLGGGLWQLEGFRSLVLDKLKSRSLEFATVEIISDPAEAGALALAASI